MVEFNREIPFKPLNGYVLLKKMPKRQSAGGIIYPEVPRERDPSEREISRFRVVAVGGCEMTELGVERPVNVSVGDIVLGAFPHWSHGADIKLHGEEYTVAQAKFVCGVVTDPEA